MAGALIYATWSLNTHAMEGSDISPYEMVYGEKPTNPAMCMALDNPVFAKQKKQMTGEEYFRMLRSRLADVHTKVTLARLERIRYNNAHVRQRRYSRAYKSGDLVLLWRPSVQAGIYGKLAYKSVGPFQIMKRHPKNDNVYLLRKLGDENSRVTSHHVRDLCPYISKEAQVTIEQKRDSGGIPKPRQIQQVKSGDFLMLPYGRSDFIVHVDKFDERSGMVSYQYLNTRDKKDRMTNKNMKLVWKLPNQDGAKAEVYMPKLTPTQIKEGYQPMCDEAHIDEFYQCVVELGNKNGGHFLPGAKKAHIKRHPPLSRTVHVTSEVQDQDQFDRLAYEV